jgi:hypothetical protein
MEVKQTHYLGSIGKQFEPVGFKYDTKKNRSDGDVILERKITSHSAQLSCKVSAPLVS